MFPFTIIQKHERFFFMFALSTFYKSSMSVISGLSSLRFAFFIFFFACYIFSLFIWQRYVFIVSFFPFRFRFRFRFYCRLNQIMPMAASEKYFHTTTTIIAQNTKFKSTICFPVYSAFFSSIFLITTNSTTNTNKNQSMISVRKYNNVYY